MADLYVALLHHPVQDKYGNVVTSSVTNIDVHDLARSCRTYGVSALYVVTPVDALRGLVRRIMRHWEQGQARDYNPTRAEALGLVRLERTLEGAEIDVERTTGRLPTLVATSARVQAGTASYGDLRARLEGDGGPYLLVLGTSWGLAEEVIERSAHVLEPLAGPTDYNHLSVRAAGAVILDRLRGTR